MLIGRQMEKSEEGLTCLAGHELEVGQASPIIVVMHGKEVDGGHSKYMFDDVIRPKCGEV